MNTQTRRDVVYLVRAMDSPWLLPEATPGKTNGPENASICVLPVYRAATQSAIEGALVEAVVQAHSQFMTRASTHGVHIRPTSTSDATSSSGSSRTEGSTDMLHALFDYFSPAPASTTTPQHSTDEFDGTTPAFKSRSHNTSDGVGSGDKIGDKDMALSVLTDLNTSAFGIGILGIAIAMMILRSKLKG